MADAGVVLARVQPGDPEQDALDVAAIVQVEALVHSSCCRAQTGAEQAPGQRDWGPHP
jgi:hypothetical protein